MRGLGLTFLLLCFWFSHGQEEQRCGAMNMFSNAHMQDKAMKFEQWMKDASTRLSRENSRFQNDIYEIPVVVHVLHNGSPIGSGTNISTSRIQEQIDILNQDFRRIDQPTEGINPEFLSVSADTQIQFTLARQDPEGLPTSGIIRLQGAQNIYGGSQSELEQIASESFWPQEDYLNIYIIDFDKYLGFGQFPFTNQEGGDEDFINAIKSDGIFIDHAFVGLNNNTGSFKSFGHTATHEIGHYLGLRHIWGAQSCGVDDMCEDTPMSDSSTSGCPSLKIRCGSQDMIENYMDYTNDECMSIFTECQKKRMRTVLELSPRRRSLLTSHGLEEPIVMVNDLGIRSIVSPRQEDCRGSFTPTLEIRNYGSNKITAFSLDLYINGVLKDTYTANQSLDLLEIAIAQFNDMDLDGATKHVLEFEVKSVNGTTDPNNFNNSKSITLPVTSKQALPYRLSFEGAPSLHTYTVNESPSTWTYGSAPDSEVTNMAAIAPYYEQDENFGTQDILVTDALDLSIYTSVKLDFKYAYAARKIEGINQYYIDGLIVAVSTDCGATYEPFNYVFERYGSLLSTTASIGEFTPDSESDWVSTSINLTKFAGNEDVRVAFIGESAGGNNIYIDDITIEPANLNALDGGIRSAEALPYVTCTSGVQPLIEFRNYGYQDVTSVEIEYTLNDLTWSASFDGFNLPSGYSKPFAVALNGMLVDGSNSLTATVKSINGMDDVHASNNSKTFLITLDKSMDVIPAKENFSGTSSWTSWSPIGAPSWELDVINGNPGLFLENFGNTVAGEYFLVSPNLSTENYKKMALRFRYSYAQRAAFNDQLKVLVSVDCGRTYPFEAIKINAPQMAITQSSTPWRPFDEEDWKVLFVDLSEYAQWDEVRIAIVFSNGNGNNIFIDDIDVLTTNDPDLPIFDEFMRIYPNPALSENDLKISINLSEKQDASLRIIDMSGQVVISRNLPGALNQTYFLDVSNLSGYYIVHLHTKNRDITDRVRIE